MAKNSFRPKQFEDFEILDENGNKVGEIRVKPSGILVCGRQAQMARR